MDLFRNSGTIPPEDYDRWGKACSTIGTLHHLQSLNIDMTLWNYRYYSMPDTIDDNHLLIVLSPLKSLRAGCFDVEVNAEIPDRVRKALEPFHFSITERHRPYMANVFRKG
jgi:hypothetical protein